MQQTFANVKAAAGMGIQGEPAVNAHQRINRVGFVDRQLKANERPQRVADHAVAGDPGGGQRLRQLIGHMRQAVRFRQRVGVIACSPLVIAHHLVLLLKYGQLWQPVAARSPEPGNQHHDGRALVRRR